MCAALTRRSLFPEVFPRWRFGKNRSGRAAKLSSAGSGWQARHSRADVLCLCAQRLRASKSERGRTKMRRENYEDKMSMARETERGLEGYKYVRSFAFLYIISSVYTYIFIQDLHIYSSRSRHCRRHQRVNGSTTTILLVSLHHH